MDGMTGSEKDVSFTGGEMTREWVLLVRTLVDGQAHYSQSGPFSQDEVLECIRGGSASYSDHAWKQGYRRWVRVGDIQEFAAPEQAVPPQPKVSAQVMNEVAPQGAAEELLNRVARQTGPQFSLDDRADVSFSGEDLTATAPFQKTVETAVAPEPEKPVRDEIFPQVRTSTSDSGKDSSGRLSRIGMGLVALGAGMLLITLWWHQRTQIETPMIAAEDKTVETPVAAVPKEKAPAVSNEQLNVLRGGATRLGMTVSNGRASVAPVLRFDTDAAKGANIVLQVKSKREILSRAPVSRTFQLTVGEGPVMIDLAKSGLPEGWYDVTARTEPVSAVSEFFVGKDRARFSSKLKQFQASLGEGRKLERMSLQNSSRELKTAASDLEFQFRRYKSDSKSWGRFYDKWKKSLRSTDQSKLASLKAGSSYYQAEILQFQSLRGKLIERARALDRGVHSKGSKDPGRSTLEQDFRQLSQRSQKLK